MYLYNRIEEIKYNSYALETLQNIDIYLFFKWYFYVEHMRPTRVS